jgi:phosphoribosylformylglycinamidine synthase II
MSEQGYHSPKNAPICIIVASKLPHRSQAILEQLPTIGITQHLNLQVQDLYFLEGNLSGVDLDRLAALLCDPVTDQYFIRSTDGRVASFSDPAVLEVALRPGVTDNAAAQLKRAALQIGIENLSEAATGQRYKFDGDLTEQELHTIARLLLVNDTIQRYTLGEIQPEFVQPVSGSDMQAASIEAIPLEALNSADLLKISQERRLALNLEEMQAIQKYFTELGRAPTDAELETLAQTWSEHCVHKTFKARIRLDNGEEIDGLLKSTIMAATRKIAAPWVRSSFVDNAGIIAFDDQYDLSFKVETHNHPSAIEPFGGANTGVGGVVRDVLGVSHRPIAVTDVLCFGPADLPASDLPEGVLHPRRIRSGVVAGVGDYGNKLGLATVNGAVLYNPGYTANPLVYCGCVGMGPQGVYPRQVSPGDRIIVIGGRTGRDGLRGATFSSLTMDAQTGQVAGASVQIGDPITEKGVIEVVVEAREAGLYHAITDCGAGGLSSAVGEMSADTGARVHLERAPLKYAGLAPWEIWLSEAQERMVLAVPPDALGAVERLCQIYEVELSDIGEFTRSGRLEVYYNDQTVVDLDEDFLHNGLPRLELEAAIADFNHPHGEVIAGDQSGNLSPQTLTLELLAHPNIASKEEIVRRYDHEVRGATVVRPFAGPCQDGPSDAAVLKPLEVEGRQGFALSNGINPYYGEHDPYGMAWSSVDEAIRNAAAVGADPDRLALLDNFCWGDPRNPKTLGSLVLAARGCHDAAVHYQTPFISGKDSLNNEYTGANGARHAIPGTLLISAIALHPNGDRAITMDLKSPGSLLYLVGDFQPALAGSHALQIAGSAYFHGLDELNQVPQPSPHAPGAYRALHAAIQSGCVLSAHDLSEGGLAVAAAEMALAGRSGLMIDIQVVARDPHLALFGETNSCLLVEVAPENSDRFEAFFDQPPEGRLCLRLGNVLAAPAMRVIHGSEVLLEIPVSSLLAAFGGGDR